jgi:hypothetical protein
MQNSSNSSNLGGPAVATTASGSGAPVSLPTLPPQQWTPYPPSSSGSSSSRGRGRGRDRGQAWTPYVRQPLEPKLPVTYTSGGQVIPNSGAELAAYGKAMAAYGKDLAHFEATQGRDQGQASVRPKRTRGPHRAHHGPSGNGNLNFNLYQDNDPDVQHRERVSSPSGSQLLSNQANPIGQAQINSVSQTLPIGHQAQIQFRYNSDNHVNRGCARSQGQGQGAPQLPSPNEVAQTTPNSVPQTMSNSVPQTMQTAQQALGDEFLCDFNSVNHPAQIDAIKDLDREQRDRGTPAARRVEIHKFLLKIEVTDHVEGPVAKKINLPTCPNIGGCHKSTTTATNNATGLKITNIAAYYFVAKLRAYNLRSLVRSVGGHLDHNRGLVTSNDLTLRPLKNSLKSYDDSTIIKCIKIKPKSQEFARKSRKSFKKFHLNLGRELVHHLSMARMEDS